VGPADEAAAAAGERDAAVAGAGPLAPLLSRPG
jgi:hypothetical protein